jgi:hypothetical protein
MRAIVDTDGTASYRFINLVFNIAVKCTKIFGARADRLQLRHQAAEPVLERRGSCATGYITLLAQPWHNVVVQEIAQIVAAQAKHHVGPEPFQQLYDTPGDGAGARHIKRGQVGIARNQTE